MSEKSATMCSESGVVKWNVYGDAILSSKQFTDHDYESDGGDVNECMRMMSGMLVILLK